MPLNENVGNKGFLFFPDFKAWKPFRAHQSLVECQTRIRWHRKQKHDDGRHQVHLTDQKKKAPFEGVSTYASDFVPQPVQPRTNKTRTRPAKNCLRSPTSATKHLQQFKVCLLETKLHLNSKDSTFHVEPTKSILPTQTATSKELPQTVFNKSSTELGTDLNPSHGRVGFGRRSRTPKNQ